MSDQERWLWVSAELPLQRSTGLLVYSGELVRAVARAGVDVTVVGLSADDPPSDTPGAPRWRAVDAESRGGWRSLASPLPNLSFASAGPAMREAVAELLTGRWTAVVIDHLQVAWATPESSDVPVVYVTHNHEATVRRAAARGRPAFSPRRAVLTFDAFKAARLERDAVAVADLVTAITADDRRRFERDAPGARLVELPPGWSGSIDRRAPDTASRPRRVGVLGSFDWHVKQENLRRFVAAADDVFANAGIECVVAGRAPADLVAEVERTARATRMLGWIEDPVAFLRSCRLGVIDEPLGGGFKMKSLDYVFHGVPVAATTGSAAGLPLEPELTMIEAGDSRALAERIVDVIDDAALLDRIAADAIEVCESKFRWETRAETLIGAVRAVRPVR